MLLTLVLIFIFGFDLVVLWPRLTTPAVVGWVWAEVLGLVSVGALAGELAGSSDGAGVFVTDAGTLERIGELKFLVTPRNPINT